MMIKGSIQQDAALVNIRVPNTGAAKSKHTCSSDMYGRISTRAVLTRVGA